MDAAINLLIVDENRLFREGLRRILSDDKFCVVGEFSSLSEVLTDLATQQRVVSLLICGPSADMVVEFETLKLITQQYSNLKTVLLTERATPGLLEMALESGASGFLSKNISPEALRYSLEVILLGEQIFPTLVSLLYDKLPRAAFPAISEEGRLNSPLSARESQILGCLVNGLSNKAIARELAMAEATVKVHLKSLLRKLNATNRTQAAISGVNNPALLVFKINNEIVSRGSEIIVSKCNGKALDCDVL